MKKRNFFSGGYTSMTNLKASAMEAARILPQLRMDMTQEQYVTLLKKVTSYKDTPLGDIFSNVVASPRSGLFHMSFLGTKDTVPEIVQMAQMSVCGEEIMPNLKNTEYGKVWNPLSTGLSRNRSTGEIAVASENILIETTVRSQLCANFFHQNGPWLTSNDILFIANLYGDFLAWTIGRTIGFTIQEEMPVKYIFAWYFMLLCGVPTERDGNLPLCRRLGGTMGMSRPAIDRVSDALIDKYAETQEEPTLEDMVSVVKEFTPDRTSRLTRNAIYAMMANSASNGVPITIGVDYPPYFMAFLLQVASIGRHSVMTRIIKERNRPSEIMRELRRMARAGYFYA